MKLDSRKLWMACATSMQLIQIAAFLYGIAWVFGSHPQAALFIDSAKAIMGYVRDIVGFYITLNAAQHIGQSVGEAIGRRRNAVIDDTLEEE